jgi:hypothetical protein
VEAAIEQLRDFHRIGSNSLRRRGERAAYGGKQAEAEAGELGISPDILRKLRQFADPETGYDAGELEELCRLCREHGRSWGIKHLTIIIRVRKAGGKRAAVQRRAIKNGWTTSELKDEVLRRFGRRRSGGRKPAVRSDVQGVLGQIEAACLRWVRLHAELTSDGHRREAHPHLRDLPKAVQRTFGDATESVRRLHVAVAREQVRRRLAPAGGKR